MKQIYILCNSPECLKEITSGEYSDLNNSDIFTCNLAYTYFRTNGKHFNIFSDSGPINEFLKHNNWYDIYGCLNYHDIEFIIHCTGLSYLDLSNIDKIKGSVKISPLICNGSSSINALLYLSTCYNYDKITLIGYTLNEWSGLKNIPELEHKLIELKKLSTKYDIKQVRPYVFEYNLKAL